MKFFDDSDNEIYEWNLTGMFWSESDPYHDQDYFGEKYHLDDD